jgi:hypothetical protein
VATNTSAAAVQGRDRIPIGVLSLVATAAVAIALFLGCGGRQQSPSGLFITSDPDCAAALLDGARWGLTPLLVDDLATGFHELQIDLLPCLPPTDRKLACVAERPAVPWGAGGYPPTVARNRTPKASERHLQGCEGQEADRHWEHGRRSSIRAGDGQAGRRKVPYSEGI